MKNEKEQLQHDEKYDVNTISHAENHNRIRFFILLTPWYIKLLFLIALILIAAFIVISVLFF